MNKNTKAALRNVLIISCLIVFLTIMLWGVQSGWGYVKISRFNILGDNGEKISGLSYVPKNATNETPAPAALIFHGRSNHAHSNDTWSLELARRGYVVFSPDLSGGGESDVTARNPQAAAVLVWVSSFPFVDRENINLIGYSQGCETSIGITRIHPELVNGIVAVFGPFMTRLAGGGAPPGSASGGTPSGGAPAGAAASGGAPSGGSQRMPPVKINLDTNIAMIKAKADQYDFSFIGDPEACRAFVTESYSLPELAQYGKNYNYGNGHIFRYEMVDDALHQTGNVSAETISYIIDDVARFSPAPVKLAPNNLVWKWQQFLSLVLAICMTFFIALMANLLLYLPFFETVKTKIPENKGLRGGRLALRIFWDIALPTILFVPVSVVIMRWTPITSLFTSTNLNGIIGWLTTLGLISLVLLAIRINKAKKAGTAIPLSDLALGGIDEKKLNWNRVAKSIIMSSLVTAMVLIWLAAIEGFAGVNYQFWNIVTMIRVNHSRFIRAIPYIVMIFFTMITGCMGMLVTRRLPESGNEKKDIVVAVVINLLIAAAPLAILLIAQYGGSLIVGTGETMLPQIGGSVGALDFSFGYCWMMGTMNAIITYLYRKTGTAWPGIIMCSIYAGFITVAAFTLVR